MVAEEGRVTFLWVYDHLLVAHVPVDSTHPYATLIGLRISIIMITIKIIMTKEERGSWFGESQRELKEASLG